MRRSAAAVGSCIGRFYGCWTVGARRGTIGGCQKGMWHGEGVVYPIATVLTLEPTVHLPGSCPPCAADPFRAFAVDASSVVEVASDGFFIALLSAFTVELSAWARERGDERGPSTRPASDA